MPIFTQPGLSAECEQWNGYEDNEKIARLLNRPELADDRYIPVIYRQGGIPPHVLAEGQWVSLWETGDITISDDNAFRVIFGE